MPDDEEKLAKIKFDRIVEVDIRQPRNARFHRKFFALMHVVFNNQERYSQMEDLLVEVKLKTGHYQEHITTKGQIVYIPKSISFASMDELEFERFYSRAIDVVLEHFMPVDPDELDRMVDNVLSFS